MFIYSSAEFGQIVRRRRIEQGLTQSELAEAIGRTQTWISALERAKVVPGLDSVLLVAQSLGLGVDVTEDPWRRG